MIAFRIENSSNLQIFMTLRILLIFVLKSLIHMPNILRKKNTNFKFSRTKFNKSQTGVRRGKSTLFYVSRVTERNSTYHSFLSTWIYGISFSCQLNWKEIYNYIKGKLNKRCDELCFIDEVRTSRNLKIA